MIEVRDLKKVYKTKKGVEVRALDGVSLKLPATGMVFILGKSGSGKSTLLNVIGGLDSIDGGEILIKGSSCADFKQSQYDSYRNTYVGFIFQEYNILEEMTVGANIALAIELQGRRATDEEINGILREVDLEGYGSRKPNELSGGQKQRVAIARALVKKPEIIMADEPTGALDSATGKQVFDTLKRLSRDKLVLIVSHDREFCEQYADRIIELADGKVISDTELSVTAEPDTESAIIYGDGEIMIRGGYQLTDSELLSIRDFIRASDGRVNIRPHKSVGECGSRFVPTDVEKIDIPVGEIKLISSHLSLATAFKISSGSLRHKRLRLVFTVLLSLVSFTLFGLSDTTAAYNRSTVVARSLYDSDLSYISFRKEVKKTLQSEDGEEYFKWESRDTYLNSDDIERIYEETGIRATGIFKPKNYSMDFEDSVGTDLKNDPREILYTSTASGITAIDQAFLDATGFTLVGELPDDPDEIVVSEFVYEYFKHAGYKEKTGREALIESETDLIGKTLDFGPYSIGARTVSGVLDTGFDLERFAPLGERNAIDTMGILVYTALATELEAARSYSYASVIFMSDASLAAITKGGSNSIEYMGGIFGLYPASGVVSEGEAGWTHGGISLAELQALHNFDGHISRLDGTDAPLADDEIAISILDAVRLFESFGNNRILYDSAVLTDTEMRLYFSNYMGFNSLNKIFTGDPARIAAAAYAYENQAEARAMLEAYGTEYELNDTDDLMKAFIVAVRYPQFISASGLSPNFVNEYIDNITEKYGLEGVILSEATVRSLSSTVSYGGVSFSSMDESDIPLYRHPSNLSANIEEILFNKYVTDNIAEAVRFYNITVGNSPDHVLADSLVGDALNVFGEYISGLRKAPAGYTPEVESYIEYACRHVAELCSSGCFKGSDFIATFDVLGERVMKREIEVAGVFVSNTGAHTMIVCTDRLADEIVGSENRGIYSFAIGDMPKGRSAIRKAVDFSNNEFGGKYRLAIQNTVTAELSMIEDMLATLGRIFLYVGIAFAVFAALMLSNFIGTSIAYKKHDIGILRAIGSRSSDVFRIFFVESLIIAAVNFVLSAIATLVFTEVLNLVLRSEVGLLITVLSFGIRQVALIFAISLAVAALSTFVPVYKIARMKPVDAIKSIS